MTKEELCHRFDLFTSGEWASLLQEANIAIRTQQVPVHREDSSDRRAAAACLKVQQGEVTRARQCLTGAALAPGNEDTLREMQSRRPQQVQRPIPRQVLEFQPDSPVEVDRNTFVKSLKSAPKGSSPGIFDLFFEAVSSLAQARVPAEVSAALMGARLTVLAKPDGGVRGIATGCSLRRLVGRTLAKQFAAEFEKECAPFQYALSTRAGTDCVGHMLRAATDADH